MTNLLALVTVAFATNVTEVPSDYDHVPDYSYRGDGFFSDGVARWKLVNPKGKIITTEVQKITTFTFDWEGKTLSLSKADTITNWQTHIVRQLQMVWVTNPPPFLESGLWLTNYYLEATNWCATNIYYDLTVTNFELWSTLTNKW